MRNVLCLLLVSMLLFGCAQQAQAPPGPTAPNVSPPSVPPSPPPQPAPQPVAPLVAASQNGSYLVASNGMTLYVFLKDKMNLSDCNGACATLWPPLTYSQGDNLSGLPGTLGLISRSDGTQQVTYNGMPLYFYSKDSAPGDMNGQGFNNLWYTIGPSATAFPSPPMNNTPAMNGSGTPPAMNGSNASMNQTLTPIVKVSQYASLGQVLTDNRSMALYVYLNDALNSSTCTGSCSQSWPPLLMGPGFTLDAGLQGTLGTITRSDGKQQVTYNGMPLYTYSGDAPGLANGNGAGGVWYAAQPSMTTFPQPPPPPPPSYGGGY